MIGITDQCHEEGWHLVDIADAVELLSEQHHFLSRHGICVVPLKRVPHIYEYGLYLFTNSVRLIWFNGTHDFFLADLS